MWELLGGPLAASLVLAGKDPVEVAPSGLVDQVTVGGRQVELGEQKQNVNVRIKLIASLKTRAMVRPRGKGYSSFFPLSQQFTQDVLILQLHNST